MRNIHFICVLIFTVILKASGIGDIGPGEWVLVNISQCDNYESLPIQHEINRQKINRTHEHFNMKLTLDIEVDNSLSISLDICKYVDGGCKPFQKLGDDNVEAFMEKFAKSNTEEALRSAGVPDPSKFSLEKGTYEINNYMFDYCELPRESIYGRYLVDAYLMKGYERVGCAIITVEFKETDKNCGEQSDEEE